MFIKSVLDDFLTEQNPSMAVLCSILPEDLSWCVMEHICSPGQTCVSPALTLTQTIRARRLYTWQPVGGRMKEKSIDSLYLHFSPRSVFRVQCFCDLVLVLVSQWEVVTPMFMLPSTALENGAATGLLITAEPYYDTFWKQQKAGLCADSWVCVHLRQCCSRRTSSEARASEQPTEEESWDDHDDRQNPTEGTTKCGKHKWMQIYLEVYMFPDVAREAGFYSKMSFASL